MIHKKAVHSVSAIALLAVALMFTGCSKPFGDPEPFVKVGKNTYTNGEYKSFSAMTFNHPDLGKQGFFPGKRFAPELFVETALLYDEAKEYEEQVIGTKEWEWKQIFILGQEYQRTIIRNNMGATADELTSYFEKNKGMFLFEGTADADTSFSSHYKNVIKKRFLEVYPPDDIFRTQPQMSEMTEATINEKWYEYQRNRRVDFFRDYYYKDTYGTNFPTTIEPLFGPGKIVTQEDVDIIAKWLPDFNRKYVQDPQKLLEIVGYMVSWKLFYQEAIKRNVNKEPGFKQYAKYFEHYEVVRHYLNTVLSDRLAADRSSIDKEVFQFAYWDKKGVIKDELDTIQYNKMIDSILQKKTNDALYEYIAQKRSEQDVIFINEEFKDDFAKSSERLFFEADSLTSIGKRENAKKIYRDLIQYYGYTKEGDEAYRALAMLYSDEGSYNKAIESYRNYLLETTPNDDWCKVFFMIGYTYGEYLKKLDLAAANYRWVLKNRPDCDLIDDAEFMYLHLGEPMADVEELQAENARQGRNLLK